jgi:hypothetical protein
LKERELIVIINVKTKHVALAVLTDDGGFGDLAKKKK